MTKNRMNNDKQYQTQLFKMIWGGVLIIILLLSNSSKAQQMSILPSIEEIISTYKMSETQLRDFYKKRDKSFFLFHENDGSYIHHHDKEYIESLDFISMLEWSTAEKLTIGYCFYDTNYTNLKCIYIGYHLKSSVSNYFDNKIKPTFTFVKVIAALSIIIQAIYLIIVAQPLFFSEDQ
jgi:hypothetical protein